MPLTPQQQELTEQLRAFFAGRERCFVLKGYAGTGKTFLIGQLARERAGQNREVVLMTPTGRRRDLMELERAGYLTREGEGPATVFLRTDAVWRGE